MIAKMFKEPKGLNKERDIELTFMGDDTYFHAKVANSLPISASEVPLAGKFYPVVFVKEQDGIMPVVVLGYEDGNNIQIDDDGKWRAGKYIPAVARTYPFAVTKSDDDNFIVVFDGASPWFSNENGVKLFLEDGELSETGKRIVGFTDEVYGALFLTKAVLKMIEPLLKPVDMTIENSGNKFVLQNILVVDTEKLKELNGDQLVEFRNTGILEVIYAHLFSLSNSF